MNNWKIILGIIGAGIAASLVIIWFIFFYSPTGTTPATTNVPAFGQSDTRTSTGVDTARTENTGTPIVNTAASSKRVFKIAEGPIVGATLIQTLRPTTTIARFIMQTNGHTFDLILDSPGAVPKSVSNTTIPGIARVIWSEGGSGALLQYLDADSIKTAHLGFPTGTSTSPVRVQFLPANIMSLGVSPDGTNITYLLKTAGGSDGYVSRADGANAKKLFSLPLSQAWITWPSAGTLLAQSAPAANVTGVAYSVDAQSGGVSPLLFAPGLTALADRTFSKLVYRAIGDSRTTYAYTIRTGLSVPLSFSPMPERCVWSTATSTVMYCPAPVSYTEASFSDLWRLGAASATDSIFKYDLGSTRDEIIATPGDATDGGEAADIAEIAVSPSENYLLFIRKGDRSLWGVRLGVSQ